VPKWVLDDPPKTFEEKALEKIKGRADIPPKQKRRKVDRKTKIITDKEYIEALIESENKDVGSKKKESKAKKKEKSNKKEQPQPQPQQPEIEQQPEPEPEIEPEVESETDEEIVLEDEGNESESDIDEDDEAKLLKFGGL